MSYKTKAELTTQLEETIFPNSSRLITPTTHSSLVQNIIDSMQASKLAVETVVALRAVTIYADDLSALITYNNTLYIYDESETTADDGYNYIQPSSGGPVGAAGRWVLKTRFADNNKLITVDGDSSYEITEAGFHTITSKIIDGGAHIAQAIITIKDGNDDEKFEFYVDGKLKILGDLGGLQFTKDSGTAFFGNIESEQDGTFENLIVNGFNNLKLQRGGVDKIVIGPYNLTYIYDEVDFYEDITLRDAHLMGISGGDIYMDGNGSYDKYITVNAINYDSALEQGDANTLMVTSWGGININRTLTDRNNPDFFNVYKPELFKSNVYATNGSNQVKVTDGAFFRKYIENYFKVGQTINLDGTDYDIIGVNETYIWLDSNYSGITGNYKVLLLDNGDYGELFKVDGVGTVVTKGRKKAINNIDDNYTVLNAEENYTIDSSSNTILIYLLDITSENDGVYFQFIVTAHTNTITLKSFGQLTEVVSITNQGGNTWRYQFAGSTDLSGVSALQKIKVKHSTEYQNNGIFDIDTVNDGSDYIEITNADGVEELATTPSECLFETYSQTMTALDEILKLQCNNNNNTYIEW